MDQRFLEEITTLVDEVQKYAAEKRAQEMLLFVTLYGMEKRQLMYKKITSVVCFLLLNVKPV